MQLLNEAIATVPVIVVALSGLLKKASKMCCDASQWETGRVPDTHVEEHLAGKRNKAC